MTMFLGSSEDEEKEVRGYNLKRIFPATLADESIFLLPAKPP